MNKPMRLLILDAPDNASELFINLLNKSGLSVHAERFMDRKQLIDSLQTDEWDVLVLNEEVENCDAADFIRLVAKSNKHTSVFVLGKTLGIEKLTQALQDGVAGLLSLEHPDYSVMSIRRDYDALQLRLQQSRLLRENAELQHRSRLLLDSSREAIAYVHEGMHVYANASYLALFGHQSIDDVLCMPFIDMVAAGDRELLKECLKTLPRSSDAHAEVKQLPIQGLGAGGNAFAAQMLLTPTLYEGEHCLQVFVCCEQKKQEIPAQKAVNAAAVQPKPAAESPKIDPAPEVKKIEQTADLKMIDQTTDLEVPDPAAEDEIIEFDNVEELTPDAPDEVTQTVPVVLHPRGKSATSSVEASRPVPDAAKKPAAALRMSAGTGTADTGGLRESTIAAAMSNGQMSLVYYPVLATSDMEPELYDIELSLLDTRATRYPPEELRAAVGRTSLGNTLDKWMTDKAVRVIAELHREGQTLMFMLPISSQSITHKSEQAGNEPGFAEWLAKLVGSLPLDTASLVINLHQADLIASAEASGAMINSLRERGFRVCVSHFQPGAAMTAFLADHPVDYLRLAVELTRRAGRDKAAIANIREINAELHAGSARVIATQIEDFEALGALWEADVDLVQGEYFQKFAKDLRVDSFAEQSGLLRHAG